MYWGQVAAADSLHAEPYLETGGHNHFAASTDFVLVDPMHADDELPTGLVSAGGRGLLLVDTALLVAGRRFAAVVDTGLAEPPG